MKSRTWMWTTVLYLFAALAMPVCMAAQDNPSQDHKQSTISTSSSTWVPSVVPIATFVGFSIRNPKLAGEWPWGLTRKLPILDPSNSNPFPCGSR